MAKLEFIVATSVSEDVNIVNPEGTGSNDQDDGCEGLLMQEAISACENMKRRGKGKLGPDFEELEVLSKRVKVEAFEDSSNSDGLIKALKRLSLSKAKRDSCEGCSDRSKELADIDVSLAECLLHAEIVLEWVRTRNELNMAKISLKAKDDEIIKLKNQISVVKNVSEDAAQIHPEHTSLKIESFGAIPALLANLSISDRLRKAFEFLSICKSDHVYKGSSGFSEETTENRLNFAESLVNAEILLELVRAKKELQRMKDSLRDRDVASKVEDTPSELK